MTTIRELFLKIKRTFVSKKFITFCSLGVINTLNDAIFSWIYHWMGLQENLAAVVGYYTAFTIAYFLHSKITFKSKVSLKKYVKFFVTYIPNFTIFFLSTFLTLDTMGLSQFWGTILASMIGGPVTFVILKIYTFKRK